MDYLKQSKAILADKHMIEVSVRKKLSDNSCEEVISSKKLDFIFPKIYFKKKDYTFGINGTQNFLILASRKIRNSKDYFLQSEKKGFGKCL